MPIVNREECEGKAECVTVCPYNVFTMGIVSLQERATLSFVGRLQSTTHPHGQSYFLVGFCIGTSRAGSAGMPNARPHLVCHGTPFSVPSASSSYKTDRLSSRVPLLLSWQKTV